MALYCAQTFLTGALTVFVVVVPLDRLGLGAPWVGYAEAVAGIGGVVGGVAALALVRGRLSLGFALGMVLWGAPLVVLGLLTSPLALLAAMLVIGVVDTVADVAGTTLIQDAVEERVLARVFGALEGLLVGAVALGGAATPFVIDALGTEGALIAIGAMLPIATLLGWPRLRRLEHAPAPEPVAPAAALAHYPHVTD